MTIPAQEVFADAWKTTSKFTFTHVRFGGRHRSTPISQPGLPNIQNRRAIAKNMFQSLGRDTRAHSGCPQSSVI
ncbi:hypothetical protein E1A91_D08G188000v1 [Gossypium mustelinum]|uniref:Uncharacterized protein n=1 Tax=Gossypium mustelinum TaxID=34275 RepID=A0A5D2TZK1_GOSMU|nr:hypothetical protein E1A91_D08G188000v1 [Gossypium mustelinum]